MGYPLKDDPNTIRTLSRGKTSEEYLVFFVGRVGPVVGSTAFNRIQPPSWVQIRSSGYRPCLLEKFLIPTPHNDYTSSTISVKPERMQSKPHLPLDV